MKSLAPYSALKYSNSGCAEIVALAERELSAFFQAVTRLFGAEQAEISAEDWLREVLETGSLPASAREWRLITVRALARLASRATVSSPSTELIPA